MAHAAHASAPANSAGYERRQPEHTLLHRVLAAHWPQFLERCQEHNGLPAFVSREFEDYLRCGILEHGCVSVQCRSCGHEHLVGFSCKHRGFCPSCCGRRMNDVAAHLLDSVLPHDADVRQWVCSLPWQLRCLLGYDAQLCSEVMTAWSTELMRSYERRAKRILGLGSVAEAHTGTVTFVHRSDSALRLNVHAHTLALDGVYVREEHGPLLFKPLPEPIEAEVAEVAARTAARIEAVLHKHGRYLESPSDTSSEPLMLEFPALGSCYQAAASGRQLLSEHAGQPALRLVGPARSQRKQPPRLVAEVRGVNIHAQRAIDGRDRKQLERLCRYLARPPLAHDRLRELPDGTLRLALKSPWADGTHAIVLSPLDLLARLCALVPPPYFHMTRYHGLLAPHAKLRAEIVPQRAREPELDPPEQLPLLEQAGRWPAPAAEPDNTPTAPARHPWAWLLKRVFKLDVTRCPKCQGRMRITDVARTAGDIAKTLARHGLGPQPPPPPPQPCPPGQLGFPWADLA